MQFMSGKTRDQNARFYMTAGLMKTVIYLVNKTHIIMVVVVFQFVLLDSE